MKKVLSIVLALTLVLALAVPAFATSTTLTDTTKFATGANVKVTGETTVGNIKVVIPTTGAIITNPYGLSIKHTNGVVDENGTPAVDQIISPTYYITSESDVALNVIANVTAMPAGNAKLATASLADDTTTKTNSIFLTFTMAAVANTTTAVTPKLEADTDCIVVGSKATPLGNGDDKIVLAKGGTESAPKCVGYRFGGNAVKEPTTAWAKADKVTATIAFTFEPVADTPAAP